VPDRRPTPASVASKTLNRLRTRGISEIGALAGSRVKEWFSSGDTLVMFVGHAGAVDPQAVSELTFREATLADAGRYARDIGTDSAASFRKRFSDRTRCFVVDDGTRLLHASWVTRAGAWTREVKAYLVPPPGDAYIYESFTRPDARGRGIYPMALNGLLAWGRNADVARLWVAVEEHNTASIRAVTKAGFVEAFRVPFARRVGRLQIGPPSGPRAHQAAAFLSRTPPT